MIVQTVNINSFRDAFQNAGREKQFSYDALNILYDALDDLSFDSGKPYELDVIGLCCEFQELSAEDVLDYYPASNDWESIEEYLHENTWLCGSWWDGDVKYFVFQQF